MRRMPKNNLFYEDADQTAGTSGWLTTFNDLVTLLMVFFVLVFSTSSIDTNRLKDFSGALQSGFGVLRQGGKAPVAVVDSGRPIDLDAGDQRRTADIRSDPLPGRNYEVVRQIQALDDLEGIQVSFYDQGVLINLEGKFLFDFGQAVLQPQSIALLGKVADAIRGISDPVRIEGHTDNVPIHTRKYPSNWELSAARAVQVLRYFVEREALEPARFSAVGYGDARPRFPNDTAERRSMNRRVEIILVTEIGGEDV